MSMGLRRLLPALVAPLLVSATEPRLVPDVSDTRVAIAYSFTGADLLLFGAIVYPDGRVPAHPPDIAVVVKGPAEPLLVREKAKVAGIWMNHDSERFRSVPSFYALATTRPLAAIISPRTAAIYELGISNLLLSPASGGPADQQRFAAGLVDLKRRSALYAEHVGDVSIQQGALYRARVPVPARVPVGRYTAETFLIQDGRIVAVASRDIDIDKTGFERFVATAADRWPLTYALVAIALSLLLGWIAAALFRKRAR